MTRIHLLLTPDNEHNKLFRDIPIIGFRRDKSLKDILVRAKIPQIKNKGWCGHCKGPRCEICKHIVPTRNFTSSTTKRTYEIRPNNIDCRSKNVFYLIFCKTCHNENNTLELQRHLGQGLIIIGVSIITIVNS